MHHLYIDTRILYISLRSALQMCYKLNSGGTVSSILHVLHAKQRIPERDGRKEITKLQHLRLYDHLKKGYWKPLATKEKHKCFSVGFAFTHFCRFREGLGQQHILKNVWVAFCGLTHPMLAHLGCRRHRYMQASPPFLVQFASHGF